MTIRPKQTAVNKPGAKRPGRGAPRAQIISGSIPPERPDFPHLLAELRSLGARSSAALSEVYARVAGSVLERIEQLEDVNAERRFLQRAKSVELLGDTSQVRPRARKARALTTALTTASTTSTLPAKRA